MSKWIDADAYERELRTSNIIHHYGEQIVDKIRSAPSIDIVRCQDCKYTDGEPPIADGRSWCRKHYSYMYYCSDGERRES